MNSKSLFLTFSAKKSEVADGKRLSLLKWPNSCQCFCAMLLHINTLSQTGVSFRVIIRENLEPNLSVEFTLDTLLYGLPYKRRINRHQNFMEKHFNWKQAQQARPCIVS